MMGSNLQSIPTRPRPAIQVLLWLQRKAVQWHERPRASEEGVSAEDYSPEICKVTTKIKGEVDSGNEYRD